MTLFRSSKADVSDEMSDGKFWVFDIVDPDNLTEPLLDRRDRMLDIFDKIKSDLVETVPFYPAKSYDEFRNVHLLHLEDGGDGSMLKRIDGGYEFKRSKLWLKVKPIQELDCLIVGFNKGKGKYIGTLGSIEVKVPVSDRSWSFRTTSVSGMDDSDRNYIWKNRDELLGKIAEVKFRKLSGKNRMIEPRLHRLRLDKEVI
jgi:ATP-dependent DNA ligase